MPYATQSGNRSGTMGIRWSCSAASNQPAAIKMAANASSLLKSCSISSEIPTFRERFTLVSDNVLDDGINHTSGEMNCIAKNDFSKTVCYGEYKPHPAVNHKSEGSFSRFFDLDQWWRNSIKDLPKEIRQTFPFVIVPKPSRAEKDSGCEDFDIPEYRWNKGGEIQQIKGQKGNFHPTVKPIDLFKYLVTLGSMKNDVVLDPFIGSGTLGISARISG